MFFIFTTAAAVYLKIFIQKKSGYKEFIAPKYMGGISRWQFKWMRSFYIFYDFFMLSVLSFLSYAMVTYIILGVLEFDSKPYQTLGLFLFLICLFVIIIPIDEIRGIVKPKWIWPGAPEGIIMIWQEKSSFGYIYNFIIKYFGYILLLLAIFSLIIFSF